MASHRPAMGYATQDCIRHYRELNPDVGDKAAKSLEPNPDVTQPLYFWQLYPVLGQDRIVKIVEHLYARIAADDEETWLPRAFTEISSWEHHVNTQAAFWLDAMGRGRCYHGGEGRLHFHHQYNACQVMTQVGAARWMHHMRLALDDSDLGSDPRVRATIDNFLRARMEKYAAQFAFETGDRVYGSWNSDDWARKEDWHRTGPALRCPVTGNIGTCAIEEEGKPHGLSIEASAATAPRLPPPALSPSPPPPPAPPPPHDEKGRSQSSKSIGHRLCCWFASSSGAVKL